VVIEHDGEFLSPTPASNPLQLRNFSTDVLRFRGTAGLRARRSSSSILTGANTSTSQPTNTSVIKRNSGDSRKTGRRSNRFGSRLVRLLTRERLRGWDFKTNYPFVAWVHLLLTPTPPTRPQTCLAQAFRMSNRAAQIEAAIRRKKRREGKKSEGSMPAPNFISACRSVNVSRWSSIDRTWGIAKAIVS